MFRKIGDALSRFMSGRYGLDQFSGFLCIASLILIVIGAWVSPVLFVTAVLIVLGWAGGKWLTPWMSVFSLLAYIPLIWSIVRMYSRNVEARRRENARWIGFCNRVKDRDNRYFKCPRCRQMVRVPRGKGTINIRCPKCGERFLKKT